MTLVCSSCGREHDLDIPPQPHPPRYTCRECTRGTKPRVHRWREFTINLHLPKSSEDEMQVQPSLVWDLSRLELGEEI